MHPVFQRRKQPVKLFSEHLWQDEKFTLNPADFQPHLTASGLCWRIQQVGHLCFAVLGGSAVFAKDTGHGWMHFSRCSPAGAHLNPVAGLLVCWDLPAWHRSITFTTCVTATHVRQVRVVRVVTHHGDVPHRHLTVWRWLERILSAFNHRSSRSKSTFNGLISWWSCSNWQ